PKAQRRLLAVLFEHELPRDGDHGVSYSELSDSSIPLSRADPSGRKRGNIIRVRGEQQLGRLLHSRQHIRVAHEIGHAQLRKSGLASPQQLARPAQLEIPPGDLKAVVGLAYRFEPLARKLR